MKRYLTDARASGELYRGELWYGDLDDPDDRVLVAVTKRRYVTVEDAQAGARASIPIEEKEAA